jgi:hypothetical protein
VDPGTFFLLLVVLVIAVVGGLMLAGNAGILGSKGSDPKRQLGRDEHAPEERPTHTAVDLEQSAERERRGVPLD